MFADVIASPYPRVYFFLQFFRIGKIQKMISTSLRQPKFERFSLGRWNGLYDSKKFFRIGYICKTNFAVSHLKFQTGL